MPAHIDSVNGLGPEGLRAMKLVRSCLLLAVSISLTGVFAGCGSGGPEAIPTGKTPSYDTGEIVKVEGLEAKPRKKSLREAPAPRQQP